MSKGKDFYDSLYSTPPSATDLDRFAEELINDFVLKLKRNQIAVQWNYGFESVVFSDNLDRIKEDFFERTNNKSNSNESPGTRASGSVK